jgi:hypothetical protein
MSNAPYTCMDKASIQKGHYIRCVIMGTNPRQYYFLDNRNGTIMLKVA